MSQSLRLFTAHYSLFHNNTVRSRKYATGWDALPGNNKLNIVAVKDEGNWMRKLLRVGQISGPTEQVAKDESKEIFGEKSVDPVDVTLDDGEIKNSAKEDTNANFPVETAVKLISADAEDEEIVLEDLGEDKDARIAELEAANEQLLSQVAELEAALALAKISANARELVSVKTESPLKAPEKPTSPVGEEEEEKVVPTWTTIDWPSPDDEIPFWKRPVVLPPSTPKIGSTSQDSDTVQVVHITAEMAPIAKVGGLGDVVTGLSRACISRGHSVLVMLPFYDCMDIAQIDNLSLQMSFGSYHRGDWLGVQAHEGTIAGVPVILLKPENHFFRGPRIYGGTYNELEAYLFFARACLEYLQVTKRQPDIIHCHEWHTGAVSLLYWDMYHCQLDLKKPRLVFTIHNMEHQGECKWEELDWCGLDGRSYVTVEKCVDERTIGHNPERLSLLKGGIVYSNAVTTVSPTYVQETLCSGWLSATLHTHKHKYSGILNGIDTEWDPKTDPHLPAPFSASDLAGKALCKHYVQRGLGLEVEVPPGGPSLDSPPVRLPLVICVTRLVAQKGIHLIRHAIFRTQEQGGQFVLLGSSPDPRIQSEFVGLAEEFKSSKNVRLLLTYSEALSHYLFAAADMILVPSMFEPCGLTQMIGMCYGTIPVVRKTGGLADTVFDVDSSNNSQQGNGFVFDGIDEGSLNSALDRGIKYYKEKPEWWAELAAKVINIDNSWNKSAGEYLDLYRSVRV